MFVVEALKALHGDALLLRADDKLVMVDGGPNRVYDRALKRRLQALRPDRRTPAQIALLMVSHIDDDHMNGVLDLTRELLDAKQDNRTPIAKVQNLWHNSFSDSIAARAGGASLASVEDVQETQEGALELAEAADLDRDIADVLQDSTRLVLASVRQGRTLRRDAQQLRIKTNRGFADGLVSRNQDSVQSRRFGPLKLSVLGPTADELRDLRAKWKRDLRKILKPGVARVAGLELAANLDKSVANISSLIVMAECDGKRALLTGDARSDHILEALEQTGLLQDGKCKVDLLKIPHHGSDRNVTKTFFKKVPARHYVVSGDGKHGNPEPETFEMLLSARGEEHYQIHMTYGPNELAEHPEFDETGFRHVMNRFDHARDRLRHPRRRDLSLSVKLSH